MNGLNWRRFGSVVGSMEANMDVLEATSTGDLTNHPLACRSSPTTAADIDQ